MQGSFTSQSSMVCRRERRVDCRGGWSMWGLVIYRAPSPLNGVSRVWDVTWLVLANHILVFSATLARCKLFNLGLNVVTDLCINSRIWDLFIQECCQPWIKKHAGAGNSCRVALPQNIPLMMHFMWLQLHCHLMSKCGYILFEIKVTGQLLLTMWFCDFAANLNVNIWIGLGSIDRVTTGSIIWTTFLSWSRKPLIVHILLPIFQLFCIFTCLYEFYRV